MANKIHRVQLFIVLHDLHLIFIAYFLERHRGIRYGGRPSVEPGCGSALDRALVPLRDHTLRHSFGALGRWATTTSCRRQSVLAVEAASQVQTILALVELLLHLLLAK